MIYGNPNAQSESNGNAVFELFDVQDIVAFWHMDELQWTGATGEVKDETGVNHGKAYGGATTTSDAKYGRAGFFDGVNDYVKVPDDDSLHFTDAITIEAWVKLKEDFVEGDVAQMIISLYKTTTDRLNLYFSSDSGYKGRIGFAIMDDGSGYRVYTHETFWPKDTWFHIVGSAGSNGMKLYVNGEADYEVVEDTTSFSVAASINTIGCRFYSTYYEKFLNGIIDELRIYKRALSPTEIEILYNNYMEKMGAYFNVHKYVTPPPVVIV